MNARPLAKVADNIFREWLTALADRLRAAGAPKDSADDLAATALAAMEGGLILSRARGGRDPIDAAERGLLRLCSATE